jgi:glycosyltransferase involved in cell wall biosynthesis
MLVATIEPRKGHTLLYRVWQRLLAEGIPQAARFRLVFVGRPGWMTGGLMADLRKSPAATSHIVLIHDVDDDGLAALYEAAAFCVYPSEYEGYGLPVIEAFAHGKAVIASSGGAIPELVQDLSPCLDPADEEAWFRMIKDWIVDPSRRSHFERDIKMRFRHPTWSEAAERFFAVIAAKGSTHPGSAG